MKWKCLASSCCQVTYPIPLRKAAQWPWLWVEYTLTWVEYTLTLWLADSDRWVSTEWIRWDKTLQLSLCWFFFLHIATNIWIVKDKKEINGNEWHLNNRNFPSVILPWRIFPGNIFEVVDTGLHAWLLSVCLRKRKLLFMWERSVACDNFKLRNYM